MERRAHFIGVGCVLWAVCGCQLFIDDADREVYRLIEQRQLAALGQASEVRLSDDAPQTGAASDPYSFVPHPVTPDLPPEFRGAAGTVNGAGEGAGEAPGVDVDMPQLEDPDFECSNLRDAFEFGEPLSLRDALAFAIQHARDYQDAKEDLYLQALALTLERHLWTPRFMSNLRAEYTEFPQESVPDRAMQATADVAVEQRLPYGGTVTAQWVGTMLRDLENHVTDAESGRAILQANIPLLRGGGRVAYESRYQAERDLVYAVRRYERFRRRFLTQVAGDYFQLLSTRSSINNAIASRDSSCENWIRSQALADAERLIRLEADRAKVAFLQARNRVIDAVEIYESALDEFKILIGMPTTAPLDVTDLGLQMAEPEVEEAVAIETAIRLRLDLLNTLDAVDDAERDLEIARNNLLPDLDLTGSVAYDTNPDHLSGFHFREDLETWNAGVDLEIPLDRKAERNALRSSVIGMQRSRRDYDLAVDRVRLEVRRALRRIRQAKFSLGIQEENIRSNEIREEAAKIKFDRGEISNRDFVEAQNDLRAARDDYADAQSELRQAILGFRLATGTLRVADDGTWQN